MHQGNRRQQRFIIYTPEYARDLPGLVLYAVYPDYWGENIGKFKGQHNWGEAPCLGYVKEQTPYWAGVAAYTAGLLPLNGTFKPKVVPIKMKGLPQHFSTFNKRKYRGGNSAPSNKV